jgi:chromosome segregation ATPase
MRSALVALALIPALALAAPIDDARRLTEEARRALQAIDTALAAAQLAHQHATRDVATAAGQRAALPPRIHATQRNISTQQEQIDAAAKLLPALRQQADQSRNDAGARQAALTLAQKRAELSQAAATKAKVALQKEFDARPDVQSLLARQADAKAKLDAATDARVAQLGLTADYRAARAAVEAKEARLAAHRAAAPSDAAKLADAATQAMQARSILENLKLSACAADPAVVEARKAHQAVGADLAALRKQFDQDAATHPTAGPILKAAADDQAALTAATAALKTARAAQAKADAALKEVTTEDAAARKAIDSLSRQLATLNREHEQALADLRDADLRLKAAEAELRRLLPLRAQAAKTLQDRQQQEDRLRQGRK